MSFSLVSLILVLSVIVCISAVTITRNMFLLNQEYLLDAIKYLWGIIDDIDTYSDVAKGDDVAYRSLVTSRQADRWASGISTDGRNLFLGNTGIIIDTANAAYHEEQGYVSVCDETSEEESTVAVHDDSGQSRYSKVSKTPDFVQFCESQGLDPDYMYFDTVDKVLVQQDPIYSLVVKPVMLASVVKCASVLSKVDSVEQRIEDAEQLIVTGEKDDLPLEGMAQVTHKRMFMLLAEGTYVICEPGEATHYCKITGKCPYVFAKLSAS